MAPVGISSYPIKASDGSSAQPLLSASELAAYLGVATHSLYEWRAKGVGPDYLRIQGQIRYSQEAVARWVAEQQEERGR